MLFFNFYKLRWNQFKSFSFNIYSNNGDLKKVGLLNLPEHEHWILYGPYADKSLMRNVLAYSLWEQMGYYSPKTKFCELSINGFYQGVYVLCEKVRVDSVRLNLEDGYLIKIDRPKGEFFTSTISQNNAPKTVFEIKYPAINEIRISEKNATENKELHSTNIVIATGATPKSLPSLPLDNNIIITSKEALFEKKLPQHIVIIGGGATGVEFAFIYIPSIF